MNKKVIMITGANKGMGAHFAKEALKRGYYVAACSRRPETIPADLTVSENLLPVKLDLNDEEQIKSAVAAVLARFGRIDILVNNAGYGLLGYFEESSEQQIRRQFETNVFGTMKLTKAVLPVMRNQQSGTVVSVSSTSGVKAVEGDSVYAASKFAIEGWMEGLRLELQDFGIRTMILEPGAFRTDFFKENKSFAFAEEPIDAYAKKRTVMYKHFTSWDGKQNGNPAKLAIALMNTLEREELPMRLLAGREAVKQVEVYYKNRYAEFEQWKPVSNSTDFDE